MIKTIFLHLDNLSNFPGLMNLYDISRIQALRHLAVESYKRFLKLSFSDLLDMDLNGIPLAEDNALCLERMGTDRCDQNDICLRIDNRPPAERLYPVDPVGVEMMTPSAAYTSNNSPLTMILNEMIRENRFS